LSTVIGRNIKAERVRRGLRQEELGEVLGLSRAAIGHIETGRHPVAVDSLPAVCRALGIGIESLIQGADTQDLDALHGPQRPPLFQPFGDAPGG
jgi:transcriptional regulator with XRE-family HTH domain